MLSHLAKAVSINTTVSIGARAALPITTQHIQHITHQGTRPLMRPLSSQIPPPINTKSTTEADLASSRRMQQFNTALNKDLNKTEKNLLYSQEKNRLAKHVAALEARGFSVESHPDSHSVFITKTAPSGEHIVIDFWEDEVSAFML